MKIIPFYLIYGALFLLYIINVYIQSSAIEFIISWSTLIIFILSWRLASKLFKIMSLLFALSGVLMNLSGGVPFYEIPQQFMNNIPMLIFLSLLPWMASAFSIGEYDRALKNMNNTKDGKLSGMYGKSLATTYSLTVFINVSAIYIVQQILIEKLKGIDEAVRNDYLIQVTLRTFALAAFWSPMEILFGITIEATGVSFLSYLPWLLLCSFLVAIIEVFNSKRKFAEIHIPAEQVNKKELVQALVKLFFVLSAFFAVIITANHYTTWNFIFTVAMVIFPFTLIWSLFMRRAVKFLKYGWENWKNYNNGMQNFAVLFLSLAIFSQGFNQTSIPLFLQNILGHISDYTLLIFLFIPAVYFAMGMIGVHPIATIAILLEVLNPLFGTINPLSIGIVLVVSAMATTPSSPYGINTTLTVQSIHVSPYYVTKKNFSFSLLVAGMGILIAMLLL
ncbi:hypothetical protein [Oceanobacillus luteolus]|uniref:Uncharacterized protein n=1 Tax=Oceanobacillus luteolus TaxID=1274358 RepID=A0ABW4HLF7_9BACI